jgi:flagellar protein FliS
MLAQGYARTYRANAVLTASPGQLVLMLYDGALACLARAREALERPAHDARRIEVINQQLLKAQAILAELQSGLNHEAGGEIAVTLDRLYSYYTRRLFEANMKKQVEPVIEVERLLGDLRSGWAEMLAKQTSGPVIESDLNVA